MDHMEQFLKHSDGARSWVARTFGLQSEDAADIVQDVLIRLSRWSTSGTIAYHKSYLYKACARAAWKHKRMQSRMRPVLPLCVAVKVPDRRVEEPAVRAEASHWTTVSNRKRQIVHLLESGFTKVQAARELNLKPTTVRVYLHQLRKRIRRTAV